MTIKKLFFSLLILLCTQLSVAVDLNDTKTLLDMSLDEILNMEVISAARQTQKVGETGMPVSVISAEDIHYSGLTNLYEVLQFSPGIDMLQVDRNRYALGVRGLHDVWSDRTLTLINGRSADSPIFGGSEFLRQPLIMEDIQQIEILRGPSGGAWGANAFNGAINVITKRPDACERGYASAQFNEFNDNHVQMRWAEQVHQWAWRLSGGYEAQVFSSDALSRQFPTTSGAPSLLTSRDFRRGGGG